MAKSPQEILENHVERARQSVHGLEAALSAGNQDLIALNIDQGFRACLFQGLIRWRNGLGSPVEPFHEALGWIKRGINELSEQRLGEIPTELAWIASFLVGSP